MITQDVIGLLGITAKDKITGLTGIVTSVSFDLYGCVQAILNPGQVKDGQMVSSSNWLDINRLEIVKITRIMDPPDFDRIFPTMLKVPGPAEKPVP